MNELGVETVRQGATNKLQVAQKLVAETGIPLSEICYIGDDLFEKPTTLERDHAVLHQVVERYRSCVSEVFLGTISEQPPPPEATPTIDTEISLVHRHQHPEHSPQIATVDESGGAVCLVLGDLCYRILCVSEICGADDRATSRAVSAIRSTTQP